MALNNLDLDTLEIFRTVATEGSITSAAKKLNRVQSNISTRIIQLETRLGTLLFNRVNRQLRLTDDGRVLLTYAEKLLNLAQETEQLFQQDKASGQLRLGSMESTAASRLPELLSRYHMTYPDVRVELTTRPTDDLIDQVCRHQLDAAFVAEPVTASELESEAVYQERLLLISSARHHWLQAEDTLNESLITFRSGCAYRRCLENWVSEMGGQSHRGLEMNSYHAIVACVAAGTGIALIPASVLELMPDQNSVRSFMLPDRYSRINTHLIWRKNDRSARLDALKSVIRDLHNKIASPPESKQVWKV